MDPSLQQFLDHLHSADLAKFAEALATNNFGFVARTLKEAQRPIEEVLTSPEALIAITMV